VWAFSRTAPWHAPAHELGLAVTGAVVSGTLAAGVYYYGLARISAARVATLSYLEPVSTATLGTLVLAEPMSLSRVAGILLVLVAGGAVAVEPATTEKRRTEPAAANEVDPSAP
jgi:DME family drug/metabolite transporter